MNGLKNCSAAYQVGGRPEMNLPISKVIIIFLLSVTIFSSCGTGEFNRTAFEEKSKQVADSVALYAGELATDTINGITHNFIRKADIKCKVIDVLTSTRRIEHITNLAGGYVTKSELSSSKDYNSTVHFKKDSVIDLTYYTTRGDLTIRVPNHQLDSILSQITNMAVFIDDRNITSDDVKLKLYKNKLAENRYKNYKARLQKKTDKATSNLNQITYAEENILEKQTLADNEHIDSYNLADQVNYSTVIITLYEKQKTLSDVSAMPVNIKPYEPPFFTRLGNSFINGLNLLERLLLFIVNLWGLFALLFALYFITKRIVAYVQTKAHTRQP